MIALVAKMNIKEGEIEKVVELFNDLVPKIREKEEGTLTYAICRDKSNPNTIVIVERYRDMDALQFHGSTDYFREFSKSAGPYLEGKPELSLLEEVLSI